MIGDSGSEGAAQIFWKPPFELKIRQTFLQVDTNQSFQRGGASRQAALE
jgi:hypothetical protein